MAKGLYCLKICFREQIKLNQHELQALRHICLFTVTLYVKACFTAPISINAPLNDLRFLQDLECYEIVDKLMAIAASTKLRGHMWYLSEDLVGMALFSNDVYSEEKAAIVLL